MTQAAVAEATDALGIQDDLPKPCVSPETQTKYRWKFIPK